MAPVCKKPVCKKPAFNPRSMWIAKRGKDLMIRRPWMNPYTRHPLGHVRRTRLKPSVTIKDISSSRTWIRKLRNMKILNKKAPLCETCGSRCIPCNKGGST
eukprot:2278343-Amphidinium_carterae.1